MSAFCSWRRSSVLKKKTSRNKTGKSVRLCDDQTGVNLLHGNRVQNARQIAPNFLFSPLAPLFHTEQQLRETSVPFSVNDQLVFFFLRAIPLCKSTRLPTGCCTEKAVTQFCHCSRSTLICAALCCTVPLTNRRENKGRGVGCETLWCFKLKGWRRRHAH